jgi:hypothetical protein
MPRGPQLTPEKTLRFRFPKVADQWHPTKNPTSSDAVSAGSNKKFWWKCSAGHEWEARPLSRTSLGSGCPFCAHRKLDKESSLPALFPDIALEFDSVKSGCLADAVFANSGKSFWWKCSAGHEWEATPNTRISMKTGCPFCSGKRLSPENSFAAHNPDLVLEWADERDPRLVTHGNSIDKFKWNCENEHVFEATCQSRRRGRGCPYCSGRRVSQGTALSVTHPTLASQWHPIKNASLPTEFSYGSGEKIWWICPEGHEWEAKITDRATKRSGCPRCAASHNGPERAFEALLGVEQFNKCPLSKSDIGYRPDVKLSETMFANSDGLYWHSEEVKDKNYHRDLRLAFEAEGLRILQFYADEINEKPQIVRSIINAALGKSSKTIGARTLCIVDVDNEKACDFLEQNHLIGASKSSRYVGLQGDGLVSVLGYRIHEDHVEISRFSSLVDCSVPGGFSKLLAEIRRRFPGKAIRTLVDLRCFTGHSLESAGFEKIGEPVHKGRPA